MMSSFRSRSLQIFTLQLFFLCKYINLARPSLPLLHPRKQRTQQQKQQKQLLQQQLVSSQGLKKLAPRFGYTIDGFTRFLQLYPTNDIDTFYFLLWCSVLAWIINFSRSAKYSAEKNETETQISAKYSAENETETLKHYFHEIFIIFKPA